MILRNEHTCMENGSHVSGSVFNYYIFIKSDPLALTSSNTVDFALRMSVMLISGLNRT